MIEKKEWKERIKIARAELEKGDAAILDIEIAMMRGRADIKFMEKQINA